MQEYQTLIVAVVSVLSSGVGVGVTLKTDVKWLRLMMEKMDEKLTRLENKATLSGGLCFYECNCTCFITSVTVRNVLSGLKPLWNIPFIISSHICSFSWEGM